MTMRRYLLAALPGLALALGACTELDRLGADRMQDVPTAQLCQWRGNPISGRQMRRELARRGEECGPPQPVLADAAPAAMPAPVPEAPAPVIPVPVIPAPVTELDPVAPPAEAAAADRPEARPEPQPDPELGAPLVTPACAERALRRGEAGPEAHEVNFVNRCDFPIKVLYAADRSKALTTMTGLLRPGEAAGFARLGAEVDLPGYVVCSYADAPPTAPCRIGAEPR